VGWNSQGDYAAVVETPAYKEFRNEMEAFLDPMAEKDKQIEVFHFELKKSYGDW
jgi:hypothetical protein